MYVSSCYQTSDYCITKGFQFYNIIENKIEEYVSYKSELNF